MKAHGQCVGNALTIGGDQVIFGTDIARTVGEGFVGV